MLFAKSKLIRAGQPFPCLPQVVAFVKGTRTQPQCGFSHRVLSMLNELHADYEVVNVLDELYNPGLREEIKNFSQWPTIPQVMFCKEECRSEHDCIAMG